MWLFRMHSPGGLTWTKSSTVSRMVDVWPKHRRLPLRVAQAMMTGAPQGASISFPFPVFMIEKLRSWFVPTEAAADEPTVSPPPEMVFAGLIQGKPETVFRQERFRVGLFPEQVGQCDDCGRPIRWATLEFLDKDQWRHMLTIHEQKLWIMIDVLHDVHNFLREASEQAVHAKEK